MMLNLIQSVLLSIYTLLNHFGFFEKPWVQTIFTTLYFFYKRIFENGFSKLIHKHPELFANGTIVDVGANIGYTSCLFAQVVTPPFKVMAFEPEKRNFSMLNHTLAHYHVQDRVSTYAQAIGAETTSGHLWINAGNDADHRILTTEFRAQTKPEDPIQSIDVVSLDEALNREGKLTPVSFIKIDVQGYEWPVCRGMTLTLEKNPQAVIAIEYCPDLLRKLGFEPRQVLDFFLSRDYHAYQLSNSQGLAAIDLKPYLAGEKTPYYVDLLFSRRELLG